MIRKLSAFRMSALFLLSMTLIAYELAVMRTFSVGSWSNFGSTVISIALLGYGLAGTLLTFLENRIQRNSDPWLSWSASLLGPSMVLAHVLAQKVPFNPIMITTDARQYLWIAAYYALYAVPFFIGALFIGVAFIALRSKIHQLYFWNMLGAGLGGFLILALLYLLPPNRLIGPLVVLATASSFFTFVGHDDEGQRLTLSAGKLVAAGAALFLSLFVLATQGRIHVSEFKPISYARDFPDVRRVYHSYGPTGELNAYRSSYFHIAPGLSDNASSAIASIPTDAFLGLYVDGDGPIGIMRRLEPKEAAYFDYLPMAAPYLLVSEPRVLLLRMGGGIGAYEALYHGARQVTIVEPDPALLHMIRDEPFFRSYTGNLLADPRIKLLNTEPRAFTGSTDDKFDLVEISLVDSIGLSQTGGYPVSENFLYTVEGMSSYLSCLSDNGYLSITVWNRLTPPRNVPKLLTTIAEALRVRGLSRPEDHVFVFDQLLSTATIVVKNLPFRQDELEKLRGFCAKMSFTPCYYPGMPRPEKSFGELLQGYRDQLQAQPADPAQTKGEAEQSSSGDLLPENLYYYTLASLFQGRDRELYDGFVFSIRPATDDRPYYTAYVKPTMLPAVAADLRDLSEEWGYVLLVATFGFSILFGLVIVLVPMLARRKELFRRQRGTFRVIIYFSCLGLGYMLIEIFLIQRLTFFLVDPIFSNSVVITSMLVISGVGSLLSGGSRLSRKRVLAFAVAGICASILFYIFGLSPLVSALLGLPLATKILIAILVVAPAAFCLGMPFPTGLTALSNSRPGLIPWAWGVNGALSVTGTVLARLVSISAGFRVVLGCAIGLYALALLSYSGNEVGARCAEKHLTETKNHI